MTDAKGRFALRELPEGTMTLEAYAPGLGRARAEGVKVVSGRTTDGVHVVIAPSSDDDDGGPSLAASGSVAVTLGETGAPTEVVVVSVVEGSEAERAGHRARRRAAGRGRRRGRQRWRTRARSSAVRWPTTWSSRCCGGDRALTLRVAREAVRR